MKTLVSWRYYYWIYTRQFVPSKHYPAFKNYLTLLYMNYFRGIV